MRLGETLKMFEGEPGWKHTLEVSLDDIRRWGEALEMIAGRRPCPDTLLGNSDIARMALDN